MKIKQNVFNEKTRGNSFKEIFKNSEKTARKLLLFCKHENFTKL